MTRSAGSDETFKPRILMLTCQYPPDVYGGAEQQCRRVSLALLRQGYHVQILTSSQNRTKTFDDGGVQVTRIYTGIAPDLLGRMAMFSLYWLLRVLGWGFAHRHEFDVIHCHQGKFGSFVGCVLGRLLNKPVLVKIGNSGEDMDTRCLRRKWLFGPLCYHFVKRSNPVLVAITQDIERDLQRDGWKRRIYIPNGVSRELRPDTADRIAVPGIHLFYHGRIESIKRVPLLIEAFALVNAPDSMLHVFGDGAELPLVEQTVARLGLQDRVKLWGPKSDVLHHVASLDIFVNASRSEGFSNSLLEALLCEKVLVSTPVSGSRDAIAEGVNGAVAASDSAEDIARAIEKGIEIFTSQPQVAQAECRRKVNEQFDVDLVVGRYKDLYLKMVTGGGCQTPVTIADSAVGSPSES